MYLHNTLLKSTIFRTITDESTGAVKSIGLFGKSITDLRNSLNSIRKNGVLNTIFNTSTIDAKKVIVEEYNNNESHPEYRFFLNKKFPDFFKII